MFVCCVVWQCFLLLAVDRLPLPLLELDEEVPGHSEPEHGQHDPELGVDADVGLEDVGEDEAERLPETVVGEGGLLVLLEENSVKGWKCGEREMCEEKDADKSIK